LTLAFAGGSGPSHVAAPAPSSSGKVNASAIAARVDQGVVDITAQEAYSQSEAEGTGMILTSKGEVLTNNHVVDGASSISVRPVDGQKSYSASVVGVDPTADVALLQLHGASGLKTVPLGNSSKVKVGNAVVAIGNAGGVGGKPTVTQGTVTALNRSVTASDANGANPENLTGMLQSSAQLASGDSGGPLVNSAGKVVGMDTAAPSGGEGPGASGTPSVGWAIPINKALSVVSLVRSGSSNPDILLGARPFIGVDVTDASQASQSQSPFGGFPGRFNPAPAPAVNSGAYVEQVISGSPAANAGIQAGDVITSFDGHTVSAEKDLSSAEAPLHPGQSVSIGWVDGSGQSHSATITLGTGPAV
jgi:S1-C subfamily serine protease